jgi:hypothetical protein
MVSSPLGGGCVSLGDVGLGGEVSSRVRFLQGGMLLWEVMLLWGVKFIGFLRLWVWDFKLFQVEGSVAVVKDKLSVEAIQVNNVFTPDDNDDVNILPPAQPPVARLADSPSSRFVPPPIAVSTELPVRFFTT